jgi:DnaJ homolog subfamily A member 5
MASSSHDAPAAVRCHYEVLGVERTADAATIKKAHRKLALKLHPDKNIGNVESAAEFLLVQQAYECLSDERERHWYDEHREAILKGWTGSGDASSTDFLFDVIPFMYAGCYSGYDDSENGFYSIYGSVFEKIYEGELSGTDSGAGDYLATPFGTSTSPWDTVAAFYRAWESFSTALNFAWTDPWDLSQAENRQVRRAMEDENKKARKTARRVRSDDIVALVRFLKRRDPRVKARLGQLERERATQKEEQKQKEASRKKEKEKAKEEWRQKAEEHMAALEEMDREAGRVRLADLEDDYDYGGKKGKRGKKKKNKQYIPSSSSSSGEEQLQHDEEPVRGVDKNNDLGETVNVPDSFGDDQDGVVSTNDSDVCQKAVSQEMNVVEQKNDQLESSEEDDEETSEEEIDEWRCECCKKDFKSQGQIENHMNSKKHKVAWKKYESMLAKLEDKIMESVLNDLTVDDDNE